MRIFIFTIVSILAVSTSVAQSKGKTIYVGDIISDTTTFGRDRDLPSILKSKNEIELRFIKFPSFDYTSYTVMTFDKEWKAKHYYYNPGKDSLLSKNIIGKMDVDSVFSQLVSNNIFSLPDQNSLRTVKYTYDPETGTLAGTGMSVNDGTCYCIEFKVGDLYRRYMYCNPEDYKDFYTHVHELREFSNIVKIMEDFIK